MGVSPIYVGGKWVDTSAKTMKTASKTPRNRIETQDERLKNKKHFFKIFYL
jgi:hypothetical protein